MLCPNLPCSSPFLLGRLSGRCLNEKPRPVCAGGVLESCVVPALALSKLAAKSSTLRVGLGLNATGDIALTHAQLPEDRALIRGHIRAGAARLRVLGANAGQLVKVRHFDAQCRR